MPEGSNQLVGYLGSFIPLILAMGAMYFLMIKPQKKKEKEISELRASLQVGDKVLTVGGIKGTITKAGEDFITIKSGETSIEFTRSAVYKKIED